MTLKKKKKNQKSVNTVRPLIRSGVNLAVGGIVLSALGQNKLGNTLTNVGGTAITAGIGLGVLNEVDRITRKRRK